MNIERESLLVLFRWQFFSEPDSDCPVRMYWKFQSLQTYLDDLPIGKRDKRERQCVVLIDKLQNDCQW